VTECAKLDKILGSIVISNLDNVVVESG